MDWILDVIVYVENFKVDWIQRNPKYLQDEGRMESSMLEICEEIK